MSSSRKQKRGGYHGSRVWGGAVPKEIEGYEHATHPPGTEKMMATREKRLLGGKGKTYPEVR